MERFIHTKIQSAERGKNEEKTLEKGVRITPPF